jgi:hypothetical protein
MNRIYILTFWSFRRPLFNALSPQLLPEVYDLVMCVLPRSTIKMDFTTSCFRGFGFTTFTFLQIEGSTDTYPLLMDGSYELHNFGLQEFFTVHSHFSPKCSFSEVCGFPPHVPLNDGKSRSWEVPIYFKTSGLR